MVESKLANTYLAAALYQILINKEKIVLLNDLVYTIKLSEV